MRLFRKILLWVLLLLPAALYAQEDHYARTYTANDGLPSSYVTAILQDSRHFLWVGTNVGISRFDGKRFINYTAPADLNFIFSLDEDEEGRIWALTQENLFFSNGATFQKAHTNLGFFISHLCYKGKVWLHSDLGLYTYDKNGHTQRMFEKELAGQTIKHITKCSNGILISTLYNVYRYNGSLQLLWHNDRKEHIFSAAEDKHGRIWVNTDKTKIRYIENGRISDILHSYYNSVRARSFILNRASDIVVIGLSTLDVFRNGNYEHAIASISTDSTKPFLCGIQDAEGSYWLASSNGLTYVRPLQVKRYTPPEQPVYDVYTLPRDTNIYLVREQSIYVVRNDSFERLRVSDHLTTLFRKGIPGQNIYTRPTTIDMINDGTMLVSSNGGHIIAYKNDRAKLLADDKVLTVGSTLADADTTWFFMSYRLPDTLNTFTYKIFKYARGTFTQLNLKVPAGSHFRHRCAIRTPGGILIGTDNGLLRFNDDTIIKLHHSIGDTFLSVSDLSLYKDGSVFIATKGKGLIRARIVADSIIPMRIFTTKDGLATDHLVRAIVVGSNLWVTALNGLYRISEVDGTPFITHLNTDDGMPANSWTYSSLCYSRGYIYMSGSKGLVRFRDSFALWSSVVQRTHITTVSVNDSPFVWNSIGSIDIPMGAPVLRYDENRLTFHFTGINYGHAGRTKYQYLLEHFSTDTIITTDDNITYHNLPPGSYVFKVRSTANDRFYNEQFACFPFSIAAPFWQRTWFLLLSFLSAILLIVLGVKWRLDKTNKERELQLTIEKEISENKLHAFQARMNPHFIFNSLNSIQHLMLNKDNLQAISYLSSFSRLLRQVLDNSTRSKVLLSTELQILRSYIELEHLRFDCFTWQIHVPDDINADAIEIPGLLIQPFVENAIVHGLIPKGKDGILRISFLRSANHIVCTVEDNGIGRQKAADNEKHRSHGVSIAANRLALLNDKKNAITNHIIYEDILRDGRPGGTNVIIHIPIL